MESLADAPAGADLAHDENGKGLLHMAIRVCLLSLGRASQETSNPMTAPALLPLTARCIQVVETWTGVSWAEQPGTCVL
jgi:hypothetical protein